VISGLLVEFCVDGLRPRFLVGESDLLLVGTGPKVPLQLMHQREDLDYRIKLARLDELTLGRFGARLKKRTMTRQRSLKP